MSMSRSMLMSRLKAAYEANNIPVDAATAAHHKTMSTHCLLENTIYWEAKARGANPREALGSAESLAQLGAVRCRDFMPVGARCTNGGRAQLEADKRYHGSYVE